MPFIVDVAFHDNSVLRTKLRPSHVEYLEKNLALLLAAGAKLSEEGAEPHGSLYILDCETLQEAEAFIANEPYYKNGLYRTLTYSRWRKAFFDHVRQTV
jgi:uncharacterized protein YciI